MLGEVHHIKFESDNNDDFHAIVALTQNADDIVDNFVCLNCATAETALNSISISGDAVTSRTMSDSSASSACGDGSCYYMRTSNPCSSSQEFELAYGSYPFLSN